MFWLLSSRKPVPETGLELCKGILWQNILGIKIRMLHWLLFMAMILKTGVFLLSRWNISLQRLMGMLR